MDLWEQQTEPFSDFLAQHKNLRLHRLFHELEAWFLYPPHCSCKEEDACRCAAFREQVALCLHIGFYNRAEEKQENSGRLSAIRFLFEIPDDHVLRRNYGQSYSLWLIEQEWQAKEVAFKAVDSLIETLLRLGYTYELCDMAPQASVKEAIGLILGKAPLKTKARKQDGKGYLCGEKGYSAHFKAYKPICHFVMAYQRVFKKTPLLVSDDVQKVKEFLGLAQWVREELLYLQTPNVKGNSLFANEALLPLPPWVKVNNIEIPLAPIEEKSEELKKLIHKGS